MCESERCRFLAASKRLQQFRERFGMRVSEVEWFGCRRGGNRVGKPKANLTIDQLDHDWLAGSSDLRPIAVA
jgi:hypothetical protein